MLSVCLCIISARLFICVNVCRCAHCVCLCDFPMEMEMASYRQSSNNSREHFIQVWLSEPVSLLELLTECVWLKGSCLPKTLPSIVDT